MLKRTLASLLAMIVVFIAITLFALEASDVVSVETKTSSNSLRRTHIWFVESDSSLYLEAGSPQNAWVKDLQRQNTMHLTGAGLDGKYGYKIYPQANEHTKIRNLMREKYGWRDVWVDLLFDTSQSQLVHVRKLVNESP